MSRRSALVKALAPLVLVILGGAGGAALLEAGTAVGSPSAPGATTTSTATSTSSSTTETSSTSTTETSSSSTTETSSSESSTTTSTTTSSTTTITTTSTSTATTPPQTVSVYPIVGSQVASPQAQVAFRGVNPSLLSGVTVKGSQSGPHAGKIAPDSDQRGGSFLPAKPFVPGEIVTVTAPLHLVGAPGGTYRFTVAKPAGNLFPKKRRMVHWTRGSTFSFHSRPDLKPATVHILKRTSRAGSADIFLTPQFGPIQNGAMILNASGGLVWFSPVPRGDIATDVRVQSYHGKHVLTWWQGYTGSGAGSGVGEIYDAGYRHVATVVGANGLSVDLHELQLTPQGTALVTSYYPVISNASSVGGSRTEIVFDGVVQEIDIPTGLLLFQWDSLDHVPVSYSYAQPPRHRAPFDYFHINSAAQDGDGNLIISSRNTWAAYKVRRSDGRILWTLGGKHSSFKLGPGASFAFQHDVRVHAKHDRFISLFDDGGGPPTVHSQSRGLKLLLNLSKKTARVAGVDEHAPALSANFEGNMQQLPNFDNLVGWGQQPYFSEYDPAGRIVLDGRFVSDTSSYRTYRFPWSATPATTLPSVTASRGAGHINVYMSWNGATTVAGWSIFAGRSATSLKPARQVPNRGFETATKISGGSYVQVKARNARGNVLASSHVVKVG